MPDLVPHSPILLTGATTHTGRRLAARLLECGATLRCLVHTPEHRSRLPESERLTVTLGSAEVPADLGRALEGVATVLHLAGHRLTPSLAAALVERERPVRLIVVSSTRFDSRYPTPIRESVRRAERIVEALPKDVAWTILRPSMIFGGAEDNNFERLARFVRRNRFFPLFGSGRNLVQPLFVWDLVEAHLACLTEPRSVGRTYTLAGPEAMPYRAMVEAIARAAGAPRPLFVPIPRAPAVLVARALRRLWPRSPLNPEMIERFGEDKAFDIAPARAEIGFRPIPLEEALARKFRGEA